MSHQAEAEENLRVIRSLMEKATIYRAISAPGALFAGVGAVAVASFGIWSSNPEGSIHSSSSRFIVLWLGLLVVTAVVNFALLARDAHGRGELFVSQGMRLALRAMLPAMLGGGVVAYSLNFGPPLIASFWVLFYGISLLAAAHFAPKSICWLGRAFFLAGMVLFASAPSALTWLSVSDNADRIAHMVMGATFGLFHLIYAAGTWPRKSPVSAQP